MMQLVVLLSVVLSVLYSRETDACPDGCSCGNSSECDGTYVDCAYKGLSGVPTNISTDTCHLELGGNQITVIPNGIFDIMVNLQYLYLYTNQITVLPTGIFNTLVNLKYLYFHENKITVLPDGMFDTLVNLQRLILSSNKITTLPDGIFDTLVNLHEL
ncbi:carboxypeptidase N subunit 2-like [Ostrea edulis]|uniref:carboxypeptidase N subunit 2-like n=1 Tax=Ostrea edulis TaxID=37623 RepID=UPI0024AFE73C|nr:carboxypeptidase N subunit 2-like [Ostrea edulis]